jgi:D-glycero-D-manno-heptose 1,7-bisphosphate phosphatase
MAAHTAGCEPHLVLSGRAAAAGDDQLQLMLAQVPTARVHTDLAAFVEFVLQRDHSADSGVGSLG